MELVTKPDFEEARVRWRAFWQHEMVERPCTIITSPRDGAALVERPEDLAEAKGDPTAAAEGYCAVAESRFWGGEAMPYQYPDFGPDVFGAFLGAGLQYSAGSSETSWSVPFVESWEHALPLRLDPGNETWRRMLETVDAFARAFRGRMVVGMLDMHSNLDALSAIRGPERLLLDIMDSPEMIDRAMADVRPIYPEVYNAVYEAGEMAKWGTVGWLPFYCENRFATVQSDVICMLSPKHVRRWVLPALEEECGFLDHSILHLDGPDALVHLDDILAIEKLDGIQWVPGDGNPPVHEWMDLLKRIQAAGKSLYLAGDTDVIKQYHRELRPELCCYVTWAASEGEARAFLKWLEDNS